MIVKDIKDEDFVNYKKPSMFIAFPNCNFKCDKEYGEQVCQNSLLAKSTNISISSEDVIKRYLSNPITSAIVIGGLEPFMDFSMLYEFIREFRKHSEDDVVIYTGYYKEEIFQNIEKLKKIVNITVKFGRYIPTKKKHYDHVLGVFLASDNQYAERI